MASLSPKDPNAVLPYTVDLTNWLASVGEVALEQVAPLPTAEVVSGSVVVDSITAGATSISLVLSGGTDKETNEIVVRFASDVNTYIDDVSLFIRVRNGWNRYS